MEADCSNHPLSNAATVTARLQAALAAAPVVNQLQTQLQLLDTEGTGRVSISDLQVSGLGAGAGAVSRGWSPHGCTCGYMVRVGRIVQPMWGPDHHGTQTPCRHARHWPPLHMPAVQDRLGGQDI